MAEQICFGTARKLSQYSQPFYGHPLAANASDSKPGTVKFDGLYVRLVYDIYTIWLFNIAMEDPNHKWRFIAGKIIYKWVMFHGYVK
jgi:hypothetical protein